MEETVFHEAPTLHSINFWSNLCKKTEYGRIRKKKINEFKEVKLNCIKKE